MIKILKGFLWLVILYIVADFFGLLLWVFSGQAEPTGYYLGILWATIIRLFI